MAKTKNTNLLSNAYNKQGYNPGFTDVFTATAKGMAAVGRSIAGSLPSGETHEDRVVKSEIKNANKAIDFDYSSVPPELLDQVTAHINDMSRQHAIIGMNSAQYHYSDLDKVDMDQNQNIIKSGVEKLKKQFLILKELREDWKEDNDNESISSMVSNEDKLKIHAILNNQLPMNFTPDGRIMFGEGDEAFGLDNMPSYYNKDSVTGNAILQNELTVYNAGKELNDGQRKLYSNQFQEILRKGGDQTLLSLAFDNVGLETGDGGLLGNKNNPEWHTHLEAINGDDPVAADAAREEIRDAITMKYMNSLEEQANAGAREQEILDEKEKNKPSKTEQARIEDWNNQTALIEKNKNYVIPGYGGNVINAHPDGKGGYTLKFGSNAGSTLQGTYPDSYVDSNGNPIVYTLEEAKQHLKY